MTEFPNKILLSQDRESKQILDSWVLNDYTDNIRKEYVQLDKACEWLEENKDHPLIGCEDPCLMGYLTKEFISEFRKAMEAEK